MLLKRQPLSVDDATRRVVALQAQHPASPYIALWNRLSELDPAALDVAFAGFSVVRSTLLRVTMHAVPADDYAAFREAMDPSLRASRLRDDRFTVSGLRQEDVDALMPELFDFAARPRTADEFKAWLAKRSSEEAHPGVWWALRQYAPLWHTPTGGPWSYETDRAYVAANPRPTLADDNTADAALRTLVKRYLAGFGPASVADVAQFTLIKRSRAKRAIQALEDELERLQGPNGEALYDLPGAYRPDEQTPAPPRLLGMWDNVLLAHVDRSRVIPEPYRKHVIRVNGDALPTLLVDGYVAGVWRVLDGGIEATAFHPLSDDVWDGLAAEGRELLAFLAGRELGAYRRYDHWWGKQLPAAERRLLPGG